MARFSSRSELSLLLVGHREHAVPVWQRFFGQILLATSKVQNGGSVITPTFKNCLKAGLRLGPLALSVPSPRFVELPHLLPDLAERAIFLEVRISRDQFVDRDRLQLAFHSDQTQFPEDKSGILGRGIGR